MRQPRGRDQPREYVGVQPIHREHDQLSRRRRFGTARCQREQHRDETPTSHGAHLILANVRVLGIDYGARRVGLALSDATGTLASPWRVVERPRSEAETLRLIAALVENLKAIQAEGIESIWARAKTLSRATRAGIEAIGLEIFAQRPADGLTAVRLPTDVDGSLLVKRLESQWGIKVAGGQGHLKGKIFRIAHMGIVDELDIIGTLAAIELVLDELGRNVEFGAGPAAATRVLAESRTAAVG